MEYLKYFQFNRFRLPSESFNALTCHVQNYVKSSLKKSQIEKFTNRNLRFLQDFF